MREDFEQFQAMEAYKIWENEFNRSALYQTDQRIHNHTLKLREQLVVTDEYIQKTKQQSLHLNPAALEDIADNCIEFNHILITNQVMYVKDISRLSSTPFNSIVFYLNQHPLKSKETTTEIMNRYFESNLSPYDYIKLTGRSIGIQKCCPYIYNTIAFVPEKGPTNTPVSWYAMHHVLFATKSNQAGLTCLLFRNQNELLLDLGKKGYENSLSRVINLYSIQQLFKNRLMADFDLIEATPPNKELNVIQKRLQTSSPILIESHSLQRFLNYLLYFKAQELMTKIFGSGNPYIDDVMSTFKKPPFRFRFHK